MKYCLQNGIALKTALSAQLKLIILLAAGALALSGCGGDDLSPSGTSGTPTDPPPKQVENSTVATPTFNPNGGEFVGSVEVSITSATPIATIHFTMDGSLPTTSSPVYTGPITLTQDTEIKAMGVLTGANDSGVASASFTITEAPDNNPPVIAPIANQTVTAGEIISFGVQTSDAEGTVPSLSANNLPAGASFSDNGDGSAAFEWATTTADVGTHTVTIVATDATDATIAVSTDVTLTVNANPIVDVFAPAISPNGGEFTDSVSVTLSTSTTGATIFFTLDGSTPSANNGSPYSGPFALTATTTVKAITVLNNQSSAITEATFTAVAAVNNPPVISPIDKQTKTAGETISFTVTSSDPDGTTPTLSATGLPGSASFTPQANGSADFSWVTTDSDVGSITITITATDAADPAVTSAINVVLEVLDVTAVVPPSISPSGGDFTTSQEVTLADNAGGATLFFTLDGSTPSATNGTQYTGPFTVTETTTVKAVAVLGTDSSTVAEATFTKTVAANSPPVISPIGAQTIKVNNTLTFTVNTSDADGTVPVISATGLPAGAQLTDNGNGTASFSWTPTATGDFQFTVSASDGIDVTSANVTISVTPASTTPPPKEKDLGNVTHYWQFEDGPNSFKSYIDSTTATCTNCPAAEAGPFLNAEKFNGTSNILSAPYDDRLAWSGGASITVEAWIKLDGTCQTAETVIGRFDQVTGVKWSLGCDNSFAAFNMVDSNGASIVLTGTTNIANNQWHHIAAVRSGNSFRLFVDGVQNATQTNALNGDFIGNAAPLTLGGLLGVNQFFMGSVDEVAIHLEAVAETEIKQHAKDGQIGLHRGLRGCESTVKITPLGDSITVGQKAAPGNTGGRASYRPFLFKDMEADGYNVEFIGHYKTTNEGITFAYDNGHLAISGATPLIISDAVNNRRFLEEDDNVPPNPLPKVDIVLVHMGTNIRDKATNTPYDLSSPAERQNAITEAIGDLGTLLDGIYRINGDNTVVVLAKIVQNLVDSNTQAYTNEFNSAVATMANARAGDRLILVDQSVVNQTSQFNPDKIHPNDAGSQVMANVWRNKLSEFMPVCTP